MSGVHMVRTWAPGTPPLTVTPRDIRVRVLESGESDALGRLFWAGFGATGPDGYASAGAAAREARDTLAGKWGPVIVEATLAADAVARTRTDTDTDTDTGRTLIAAAVVVRDDAHDLRPLLAFLVTEPAHRRRGLGRLLLDETVRRLDALGVHELHLAVDPDNPARELYRRAGFGRPPADG
jgi:ribosomal protein S18 acetylase RimI-like enzyme